MIWQGLDLNNQQDAMKFLTATVIENPYIPKEYRGFPVVPTPKQMKVLLTLDKKEILYGGAAGGGKTFLQMMASLMFVEYPYYHAAIVRRNFPQLSQFIEMSHDWLQGTDAHWSGKQNTWTFPSGATLQFGHLLHENSKYDYQGKEYNFIGFDELTQFSYSQYTYLMGRIRKHEGSIIPNRIIATANPGGLGHEWVKQRFITESNENRLFIPSKLEDNPYIDKEDYEYQLSQLSPIEREQLRNGNWDVEPQGTMFDKNWFRLVDRIPHSEIVQKVRYWDLAATEDNGKNDPDWTVGALVGITANRDYYVMDIQRLRGTPNQVQNLVRSTAQQDGVNVKIYMEQEGGSGGKNTIDFYRRYVLQGFSFWGIKSTKSKTERATPFASTAEGGNIYIYRGMWLTELLNEINAFPQGSHDDQVDAVVGGFNQLNEAPPVMLGGKVFSRK